jgi:hypothetical protein
MKILSKEIEDGGGKYLVYVMDLGGSPLECSFATKENKKDVINTFTNRYSEITSFEEMTYNEYINQ